MTGGLLQLIAKGQYDSYFTTNTLTASEVNMSLFKTVYRKFSHFGKQLIELDSDNTDNSFRSPNSLTTLKYSIKRNGSLVNNLFLEFELPSIYSDDTLQFQWIRRIGEYFIKEARIMSSNNYVYQRITGEYIHIYHESHLSGGAKTSYYKSIGHIPELYDPASANKYANYDYPATTKPSSGDDARPSIPKHRIIVRLPFWFCNKNENALPLVSAQKNEFKLEIDIRPLNELYTVLGYATSEDEDNTTLTRIRPDVNITEHKISNFTNISNDNTLSNVTIQAYANYIFLDNQLQKLYAESTNSYLMKQLQIVTNDTGIREGGSLNIDLKGLYFPMTQFYFMFRRKDAELTNQWSNFTLWEHNGTNLEDVTKSGFISEYNNQFLSGFSSDILTPDIITHTELRFNGNAYYKLQPIEFLNLNRALYNKTDGTPHEMSGIYNFSFALNNESYQPNGICNFTVIDKVEMFVLFKNISNMIRSKGETFTSEYEYIFLFENLNILEIQGGLAHAKFIN